MKAALLACLALSGTISHAGFHQGAVAVAKGVSIHYTEGGKGDPVMLVHGFGETSRMWRPLMPELAKHFTVIVPDLPGLSGSSALPSGNYDMKSVARHLHSLVHRLGFTRISLVGHDIGLMTVYAYAAQYPDEVKRLILMDAPIPGIGQIWPQIFNNPALWHFHFPNSPIALKLVKGRERTFLDHFWISFSGNPEHVAIPESERRAYSRIYARPGAMAAALGYFKGFPRDAVDNAQFLKRGQLPMPTLTIEGEKGMGGALETQAKQAAVNVRSIVLKGAGHWIMEERPAEVHSAIVDFLQEGRS